MTVIGVACCRDIYVFCYVRCTGINGALHGQVTNFGTSESTDLFWVAFMKFCSKSLTKRKGFLYVLYLGFYCVPIFARLMGIVLLHSGVFEVRATSGNTHLGGEDFDQRIMKYCISQVCGGKYQGALGLVPKSDAVSSSPGENYSCSRKILRTT